jgi:hypothetical protein
MEVVQELQHRKSELVGIELSGIHESRLIEVINSSEHPKEDTHEV